MVCRIEFKSFKGVTTLCLLANSESVLTALNIQCLDDNLDFDTKQTVNGTYIDGKSAQLYVWIILVKNFQIRKKRVNSRVGNIGDVLITQHL